MSFHSGVVVKCSAHTSCKSHLTPSSQVFKLADCPFSKWEKTKQKKQNQPRGHCGLSDCHAGCFCCMSLPLMYRLLFSLLAAALQEPRTSRDMRQNKTDSESKVYYCEEKKKEKKGILFSVASSQHLVKECLAGVLTTDLVAQQVNTFSIVDRWETLSGF